MALRLKQLAKANWPSGRNRPIAVLKVEPSQISTRYGIRFTEERDDLDSADVAVVELPSGRQLSFIRYRGNPSPGTEIAADGADDPVDARRELLKELQLDDSALIWVAYGTSFSEFDRGGA